MQLIVQPDIASAIEWSTITLIKLSYRSMGQTDCILFEAIVIIMNHLVKDDEGRKEGRKKGRKQSREVLIPHFLPYTLI